MTTAEYLKTLSDTNTLRILNLLLDHRLCVCELEALTELKQSNLSRHLSKLTKAGVIMRTKEAQWVYYAVEPSFQREHEQLLSYLRSQFSSEQPFKRDLERYQLFQENSIGCSNIAERVALLETIPKVDVISERE